MTELWFTLWWEVVKKWLRDTGVYAWALIILVSILLAIFGPWWKWRRTRRLALRPRIEPVYNLLIDYLTYTKNNGIIVTEHRAQLNQMVRASEFLFTSKRVRVFLEAVLEEGNKFRGQGQVSEGKKWATEGKKKARRLFRKMLKV